MTSLQSPGRRGCALPRQVSLVAQTAQILREGLQAGLWRDHLPGERELCGRFQISRPTVRAALEQLRREGWLSVAQGKRRRILTRRRRTAGGAQTKVIGLLSPVPLRSLPPFLLCCADELRTHLSLEGFELEFHVSQKCFTPCPASALAGLVVRAPAAVWVLFRSASETQRWFVEKMRPCLVVGTCAPTVELPSVDTDYRATARHAAGLMWRRGHRRAALLLPRGAFGGDAETEAGFREVFAASTSEPGRALVLQHDGSVAGVESCVASALRPPHPATAFLVARTVHVLTVTTHLLRRGLRIPQDVAVISRDDDAFLEFVTPAVTRYVISPESFARRLLRPVIQLAQTGFALTKPVRLMPRFVAGETI